MAVNAYHPYNSLVYMGLSTDTKPAAAIGSKFLETDTLKVSIRTNVGTWVQLALIPASGWIQPDCNL